MNNKFTIISAAGAVVIFFAAVFIGPLAVKGRLAGERLRILEQELDTVHRTLEKGRGIHLKGRLLTREEVSLVVDEITKQGKAFNINFLSITPLAIEETDNPAYQRLPIGMEIESQYRDLGLFLGVLEDLTEGVAAVKDFTIRREESLLPSVRSQLTLDVYLRP
jgi:Tfp pilus assembly protein PilO